MRRPRRLKRIPARNGGPAGLAAASRLAVQRLSLSKALIALGTSGILFLVLFVRVVPQRLDVRVGQQAPRDIIAGQGVRYRDVLATDKLRQEKQDEIGLKYNPVTGAAADAERSVTQVFRRVVEVRNSPDYSTLPERLAAVKSGLLLDVGDANLSVLLRCDASALPDIENTVLGSVKRYMALPIHDVPDDLPQRRQDIASDVKKSSLAQWFRPVVIELAQKAIRVNRQYDEAATRDARERAAKTVPPQYALLKPGDLVVRRGDVITEQDMSKLEALGLTNPKIDPLVAVSLAAITTGVVLLLGMYVRYCARQVWRRDERLMVIGGCLVATSVVTQAGAQYGFVEAAAASGAAFGAVLITLLLGTDLAVVASGAIGVLSGVAAAGPGSRIIVIAAAAGTVAAFAASYVARRTSVAVRAAVIVALSNVAIVLVVNSAFATPVLPPAIWGTAVGGIVAAVLGVAAVWVLERPLSITTDLRLAELSNPSTPILRRLMDEAPGTYHGSLTLANWCESCAAAIGANPLLARVGAYYHDIGKLEKPFYFIENQFGADNPHDRLEPMLSARIIARHPKEGYRLAKELKLPDKVCEMARQHHGTSVILYFYHKAKEAAGNGEVDETHFRHYGPKPSFKEAGILMIADTVEAAARTLTDPTPRRIQALVDRLVQAKLDDGQLDECDLTLNDIRIIKELLVRILVGVFHRRIPYPEDEEGEKREEPSGASRRA